MSQSIVQFQLALAALRQQTTAMDAHSGEAVDMLSAGIVDVASVVEAALRKAVSSAALALTIDVLLHHATPPASYKP